MKFIILFWLISSTVWALPWETNMHHIAPLMEESAEALSAAPQVSCQEDISPTRYISDKPKTEAWRAYYKIPSLLTAEMYKVKDVCEEAKKMNLAQGVTKKYALIANKTHLCDGGARACLSTLKSVSDPCNTFVQDNFQVFHTRTFIGQYRQNKYREIMDEYGNMGPSLLVINLETCKLVPTENGKEALKKGMAEKNAVRDSYYYTPPSQADAKDAAGVHKFKSDNDSVRFKAMRESLFKNIPELQSLDTGKNDCYVDGKRTLPGIADLEIVQYGDLQVKGTMAIKKLMDEQFIEKTNINPYTTPENTPK